MSGESLTEICQRLEHYETPRWAADAILRVEILTERVIDPCVGTGVLCEALASHGGYACDGQDVHDWGSKHLDRVQDWLAEDPLPRHLRDREFSVFMNPPFSLAEEFVEQALKLGARKVVCFQRMSWWESEGRKDFWDNTPPNRIYICGSRATSWRHDVPESQRVDKKGRPKTTPTAHAFYVWERGHPRGPVLHRIYRDAEAA